jgi:2-oxoacid:acceptor oxidoreductase gamma subunit (pyruvate/2-ketoisovalerate family)
VDSESGLNRFALTEIRIHGRGGQGGVTLAKILAQARHREGKSVQAFGLYAAERSGAPLQAFLRFDDNPVVNRNLIYEPDHIIVLDPTLVSPVIVTGLKPNAFILINSSETPQAFGKQTTLSAYRIATVDATAIARAYKLGTQSVPIVNTALAGAAERLLDMPLEPLLDALSDMGFGERNIEAAREAFDSVKILERTATPASSQRVAVPAGFVAGVVDGNIGSRPAIRTGLWASQQPEPKNSVPPCNFSCPAGNDVQGFLDALAKEDVDLALATLLKTTPFPSVCGRVCPGFCMQQCNRASFDEPVNVRALERFVGDHGYTALAPQSAKSQKVAVVGSGPAGLSSAYHLALLGYRVTVYESDSEIGGLMRTGIPSYRLPREALDRDVNRILDLGVQTVTNHRVDRNELNQLQHAYDAILVATGLQNITTVDIGNDPAIMQGLEFLNQSRCGHVDVAGEDIIVVGGGNTAIDAARSAWRMGAKSVTVVYRRTQDEMPAITEEVDEAIDEGIAFEFLLAPIQLESHNGRRTLCCQRMVLGAPDADGRRKPIPVDGAVDELVCDRVLLALGQSADLSLFPDHTALSREFKHLSDGHSIGAAGDLLTNEGTVTAAIGCGREMALRLHEEWSGQQLLAPKAHADEVIRAERIRFHLFTHSAKNREHTTPIDSRRGAFDEVHRGLANYNEAKRCLSCGVCNACDLCLIACPDGVVRRENGHLVFDYEYCKGCGVCISECPRAVIYMKTAGQE